VAHGIINYEKTIILKTGIMPSAFYDRLTMNGVDIDKARKNGLLIEIKSNKRQIQDFASSFCNFEKYLSSLIDQGAKLIRILIVEDRAEKDRILINESQINQVCSIHPITILHQYNIKELNAENLLDLLKSHEQVIIDNELVRSPVYIHFEDILDTLPLENQTQNNLTKREVIILEYLVDGHTNKRISRELGISVRTVEAHRSNIMNKLNARNIVDLMKFVMQNQKIQRYT